MSVKLTRHKKRLLFKSVLYRLGKLPIPAKTKLKIWLNLEWMCERMALETSFHVIDASDHPIKTSNRKFLMSCIRPEHSIIDLGCKTGYDSFMLANACRKVVGIDYETQSIDVAKRRYQRPNLTFIAAEGIAYLTDNTEQFDILILSHVLEHLDDPGEFLRQFKRFFKFVYIEVPDFDRSVMNHLRQRLGMELIYSDDDHITEFDRFDLTEMIEKNGLEIVKSEIYLGNMKFWCRVLPDAEV